MASVDFILGAACRQAVLLGYLRNLAERCGANAGHPEWTLGQVRYYPALVPTDPDMEWRRRDLLVLHPLCQRLAITDDELTYRAQQMAAAPLEGATWVFTVHADVLVAG